MVPQWDAHDCVAKEPLGQVGHVQPMADRAVAEVAYAEIIAAPSPPADAGSSQSICWAGDAPREATFRAVSHGDCPSGFGDAVCVSQ